MYFIWSPPLLTFKFMSCGYEVCLVSDSRLQLVKLNYLAAVVSRRVKRSCFLYIVGTKCIYHKRALGWTFVVPLVLCFVFVRVLQLFAR